MPPQGCEDEGALRKPGLGIAEFSGLPGGEQRQPVADRIVGEAAHGPSGSMRERA